MCVSSPPWVTLELLFSKKYSTLGIMERLAAKWKQTMDMRSNSKQRVRGTREGASSLVQIEGPSTLECWEGVPSPVGQWEEGHGLIQHVQGEHHQSSFLDHYTRPCHMPIYKEYRNHTLGLTLSTPGLVVLIFMSYLEFVWFFLFSLKWFFWLVSWLSWRGLSLRQKSTVPL